MGKAEYAVADIAEVIVRWNQGAVGDVYALIEIEALVNSMGHDTSPNGTCDECETPLAAETDGWVRCPNCTDWKCPTCGDWVVEFATRCFTCDQPKPGRRGI